MKEVTEETVKLFNEFTDAAEKNIIHRATVRSNNLDVSVFHYGLRHDEERMRFDAKFSINGIESIVSGFTDSFEWERKLSEIEMTHQYRDVFAVVFERLSEIITAHLMSSHGHFQDLESVNSINKVINS